MASYLQLNITPYNVFLI